MKPSRVAALVVGCLFVLPGVAMVLGGGALGVAALVARDDDGYFHTSIDRLESDTVAITTEDVRLETRPGDPDRLLDAIDLDVRLRVTDPGGENALFVGIGPERDVDAYLAGVAHDELVDVRSGGEPVYRERAGDADVSPPGEQPFWVASTEGSGTQELQWEVTSGRWAVVLMNADGSPGVAADPEIGVRSSAVVPLAFILLGVGALVTAGAAALIVFGAHGLRAREGEPVPAMTPSVGEPPPRVHPVQLESELDPDLSRWMWLVKWFLAIPHFVVLFFLWVAFFVLTVVAGVSILFRGVYPRSIFDFNVGVLRWSWRVQHYAATGGIGTDAYPPFTLQEDPAHPAHLDIAYPERLSRGLLLVKWWLLAIPHYLIVGFLVGGGVAWTVGTDERVRADGGGLLTILVLIAGGALLFTGRYPRSLYDLIVGLNRWIYRVIAYAALMTDDYPPFRLDQGGSEPPAVPPGPEPSGGPSTVDLRHEPEVREPTGSVT